MNANENKTPENKPFPIVAIGAAAGGAEAATELLQHLPPDTGMLYIYVQHPEAAYNSTLITTFANVTKMPVQEAAEDLPAAPDHFYIIPPEPNLNLEDGVFKKDKRTDTLFAELPINRFFSSLAEQHKEQAIGILLSGTVTDGVLGLKAIKLAGGLTFAQNDTARYQSGPKTAIAEQAADLALSPKELAAELEKLALKKEPYFSRLREQPEWISENESGELRVLLQFIQRATGVDFSLYKMSTIKRRIIRRMMLYKLDTLSDYLQYLKQYSNEVNFLYQDLLINVTSFFRDEETTGYLKDQLLPKIIASKSANEPIRVWVPACSTGQEAYSLAILIIEALGENPTNIPVQIFGTDLSESAINKARVGMYTKDEVLGISPRRLQRFFSKPDGHYRIIKSVRDLCVFAHHNIAKDPPFSRLDLISCCNLMIYLDTPLQKKLMVTFHHALNNNGYLVLGKSETVGSSAYLFSQLDKKVRVYAKKREATPKPLYDMDYRIPEFGKVQSSVRPTVNQKARRDDIDLDAVVDALLLKRFTPAGVVVNYDLDIFLFRGSTGLYLEPSPGRASLNLMKMAKPGLGFELRNMVHKAKKTGEPAKKENLEINIGTKLQRVAIEALPLKIDTEDNYFLVVFEEMRPPDVIDGNNVKDKRVKSLEAELTALREDMRAIVEAQEASNEELQSANEEIISSNEELQSINEELETSKEEIESTNEELITINQELQIRNEQLAEAQEYSEAMFTFMRESLLLLDKELRVKTANQAFYRSFQEREDETEGRLIFDLGNRQWNIPALRDLLEKVVHNNQEFTGFEVSHHFDTIGPKVMLLSARKVVQKAHNQHLVLITIEDITEHRQAQQIITEREAWFRNMADNAPVMLWTTGTDRLCNFANKKLLAFRGITLADVIGKSWTEKAHPDDVERCLDAYNASFDQKQPFELTYRLQHRDNSYRPVLVKAQPNLTADGVFTGFIGTCVELNETVKAAMES